HCEQRKISPNSLCCAGGAGGLCGIEKFHTPSNTLCAAGVSHCSSPPSYITDILFPHAAFRHH
ncbi:MAG: hypothetical protein ACK5A2_05550, partial [Bacteroidota bacterium]